jgi:hypothetical protein
LDFLKIFSKIYKGDEGEAAVLASIAKLLNVNETGEENYFLIPKSTLKDYNGSREVDLLLLHPTLGLYAIEVKNWQSLEYIKPENNPFEQANEYQDLLLSTLKNKFNSIPINIEYRVVFPSISMEDGKRFFRDNPYYANFENHTFFKEHLEDKDIFKRFFNASNSVIPNKKTFLKISSLLVPTDKLKNKEEKIIPVITKNEILFFDQKQLSILNGYTGGFRIIRGVAGTGKTVILTNFVNNRLQEDSSEKFLIVCFNRKLVDATKNSFGKEFKDKNIAVLSIFELLDRIGFDYEKAGGKQNDKVSIDEQYEYFETDEALDEFRSKFRTRLQKKPIDYFLCDETQDMPAGFMRIIYEEIGDCIFFIDEAQRFYFYTMQRISDVFHHPKFEKVSMRGRVKNLKNVYRTPSNIAKTAFEILSKDKSLNDYYKRSYYLQDSFVKDINMVLEDGELKVGEWDDFNELKKLLLTLPKDEDNVVLAYSKKSLESIESIIKSIGAKEYIDAMTMQSVKGLESQNVVIHNFGRFIYNGVKHNNDILYRQLYVLLTRAQEKIYLSIDNSDEIIALDKAKEIYDVLLNASNIGDKNKTINIDKNKSISKQGRLKLSKLRPVLHDAKEGAELVVAASELFAIIGGLFAL